MSPGERFNGLVRPTDAEEDANGYRLRKPRRLDWEQQAQVAEEAFGRNGYFVIVGDGQVDDLDEALELTPETEIRFLRLTPLVGGWAGLLVPEPALELDPDLAARLELHRERAAGLIPQLRPLLRLRVPDATPDELVSLIVAVAELAGEDPYGGGGWPMAIPSLLRRGLPFGRDDARLLFLFAGRCAREGRGLAVLRAFLTAIEVVGAAGFETELEGAFAIIDAERFYGVPDRNSVRSRL